jgi:hypothetical protein
MLHLAAAGVLLLAWRANGIVQMADVCQQTTRLSRGVCPAEACSTSQRLQV